MKDMLATAWAFVGLTIMVGFVVMAVWANTGSRKWNPDVLRAVDAEQQAINRANADPLVQRTCAKHPEVCK